MNIKRQGITHEENMELSLNVESSRISSAILIEYLENINKLILSINETINLKFSIGYDNILIDVLPVEKGSFKIPLCITKILKHPTFSAVSAAIMGALVSALFNQTHDPVIIKNNADIYNIYNEDLLTNNQTSQSVGKIAKLAVESPDIKDVTFTYDDPEGERKKVTISKHSLEKLYEYNDESEEDNEDEALLEKKIKLSIIAPVLINKPSNWKVLYNGHSQNMIMEDSDFLEIVNNKKIAFAPGDSITADVLQIRTNYNGGQKIKYKIIKVHDYPKHIREVKLGKLTQNDLFEELP